MDTWKQELRRRVLQLAPDRSADVDEIVEWAHQEAYHAMGLMTPEELDQVVNQGQK